MTGRGTLYVLLTVVAGAAAMLSFAALRSVSPVHLQYMRNMGTLASMSVSLIVRGKLWGLIACHNATPCPVSVEKRTACEQLGQILARSDQELTAHEVEDHAHGWATDLSRLINDNAYLTSAIGTRQAVQWVRDTHGADAVGQ